MKRYLFILALLVPLVTFAQTAGSSADLQVLIKQLQAQIQSLQAQIVDLQTEVQSVKTELKFSRVLTQGATGDDVKQLQEFLKNFTGSYPNGSVTGYYGPLTAAAVKNFQAQNGIASVGIVGPMTQDKLSVLAAAIPAAQTTVATLQTATAVSPTAIPYSGQTTSAPITSATQMSAAQTSTAQATPTISSAVTGISSVPATPCKTPVGVQVTPSPTVIKILSPNGGEQWQIGGTYTIKYSVENIAANKALLVYLNKGYDQPTTKTGVNSSQLIGVTTNLESYTYTVPSNVQSWPGLGNNYTISIYVEGSYTSCDVISYIGDFSDAEFSIVAGQANVPAVTPAVSATPSVTTTSGGGYGAQLQPAAGQTITATSQATQAALATQNKIAGVQAQIAALQEKLNTTTDAATRDSLKAQIAALNTQVQELQNQTYQGQSLPISTPAPIPATSVSPAPTTPSMPATSDQTTTAPVPTAPAIPTTSPSPVSAPTAVPPVSIPIV